MKRMLVGAIVVAGVGTAFAVVGPCRESGRAAVVEAPRSTPPAVRESVRLDEAPTRRAIVDEVDLETLRQRGLAILATLGHSRAFAADLPPGLLAAIAVHADVRGELENLREAPDDQRRRRLRTAIRARGHLMDDAADVLVGLAGEFPDLRRDCLEHFLDQRGPAAARSAGEIARLELAGALAATEWAEAGVESPREYAALTTAVQRVAWTDRAELLSFEEEVVEALGSYEATSGHGILRIAASVALSGVMGSAVDGVGTSAVRLLTSSSASIRRHAAVQAVGAITIEGNEHLAEELREWAAETLRNAQGAPGEARRLAWVVGAGQGLLEVQDLLPLRPSYDDLPLFHAWAHAVARATDRAGGGPGLDVLRELSFGPNAIEWQLDPGGHLRKSLARTLSTHGTSTDLSLLVDTIHGDIPDHALGEQALCLTEGVPDEVWSEHTDELGRLLNVMTAVLDGAILAEGLAVAARVAPETFDRFRNHSSAVVREAAALGSDIANDEESDRARAELRRLVGDGLSAADAERLGAEHWMDLRYLLSKGSVSVDCGFLEAVELRSDVPTEARLTIACAFLPRHAQCPEVHARFVTSALEAGCAEAIGVRGQTDLVYLVVAHAIGGAAGSRDLCERMLRAFRVCLEGTRFGEARMEALDAAGELIAELRGLGIDHLYVD